MNINNKIQLFLSLIQNQSLNDLEGRVGHQGITTLQNLAQACNRQDSEALLQHLDRYLSLNAVTQRAIEVDHAAMKPEAYNNIRDVLAPILQEIERQETDSESKPAQKKRPWYNIFSKPK